MESLLQVSAAYVTLALQAVAIVIVAFGSARAVVNISRGAFSSRPGAVDQRAEWLDYARWLVAADGMVLARAGGRLGGLPSVAGVPLPPDARPGTRLPPGNSLANALTALGGMDPVVMVIAALVAGTASLSTHGTKAGVRAVVNLSPEPVSNTVTSVAEDGLVLGGLALTVLFPTIALFVFSGIVFFCSAFAIWLWKRIVSLCRKRQAEPAAA